MNLIDFIRQLSKAADKHIKRRHLAATSLLFFTFFIISTGSNSETGKINSIHDNIDNPTLSSKTSSGSSEPPPQEIQIITLLEQSDFDIAHPLPVSAPDKATLQTARQEKPKPNYITEVKSGDNLSLIFNRAGLTAGDVYAVANSEEGNSILSKLFPGYSLSFYISDAGELEQLEVVTSPLESFVFTTDEHSSFNMEHIVLTPTIESTFKAAEIQDSLFLAAQKGGISAPITMELAGIFSGVIDFLLDTRVGDTFNVLYEEEHLNGEYIGNGSILATQFINQGQVYTALRYKNASGEVGYYNPEGESMRKAFLRNPIDYIRISSSFNPNRRHPILNTIRAHKGTDYAAPRGTPIVATSDGRITWAARNGSFGKLVVIQHGERFETKYAHLSDYARGIKKGARVSQGQIIGYVGTTGSATGPHLHYEFLMDGVHRNSRTIHNKLPKAESIPDNEMQRFHEQTSSLLANLQLHDSQPERVALAQNTISQ